MNLLAALRIPLLVSCAFAAVALDVARKPASGPPVAPEDTAAPPKVLLSGNSIPDVVDRVTPAVVSVFTAQTSARSGDPMGLFGSSPRSEQGLGSGVIVRADGLIVTNHHVIESATDLRVVLSDRRELRAKVVGRDPQSDVALLRVDAEGLPTIPFGDSGQVRVGETVLAIGNSFGIGQTVSCGIVTAKGRANVGILDDEDFLQSDAAVNPGNSGGPLLNLKGEVVGINTAIASRSGGFQGIGFAIPSALVVEIMEILLREGRVRRGQLGVVVQDLTPALARAFQSAPEPGVIITEVPAKGAAREAGLRPGDIVVKLEDKPVESASALRHRAAMRGGGAKVRVEVWRDGKILEYIVRLKELGSAASSPQEETPGGSEEVAEAPFGLNGVSVTAPPQGSRRKDSSAEEEAGLVVTGVQPSAAFAGLRRGDLIVEIGGKPVRTVEEFREAANRSSDPVLLRVRRPEGSLYVAVPKGKS